MATAAADTPSRPSAADAGGESKGNSSCTASMERGSGNNPEKAAEDESFHLADVSLWPKLALASLLCYVIPIYRKVWRIEGEVEMVAEIVADDVIEVANVVHKVAADIATELPKDSIVENDFVWIEHIMDVAIEDAEKAKAFIKKADDMKERIDEVVEPYIKEESC